MLGASMLALAVMAGACTDDDLKPTSVHVQVEGTAPGPLQLVVVTEFFEGQDDVTFEVYQVFQRADTFAIVLPYDEILPLSSSGSVVVDLTNDDVNPAQVRMRVNLDSGQSPYDQPATLSDGASLRYVFAFLELLL
jgi:hypothetical protein